MYTYCYIFMATLIIMLDNVNARRGKNSYNEIELAAENCRDFQT